MQLHPVLAELGLLPAEEPTAGNPVHGLYEPVHVPDEALGKRQRVEPPGRGQRGNGGLLALARVKQAGGLEDGPPSGVRVSDAGEEAAGLLEAEGGVLIPSPCLNTTPEPFT